MNLGVFSNATCCNSLVIAVLPPRPLPCATFPTTNRRGNCFLKSHSCTSGAYSGQVQTRQLSFCSSTCCTTSTSHSSASPVDILFYILNFSHQSSATRNSINLVIVSSPQRSQHDGCLLVLQIQARGTSSPDGHLQPRPHQRLPSPHQSAERPHCSFQGVPHRYEGNHRRLSCKLPQRPRPWPC